MAKLTGYLEVIAGPMYCGKTEELIRQVRRAVIGKKKVQVFNHAIDVRYGKDDMVYSHAGLTHKAQRAKDAAEILAKTRPDTEIVAIDEAQWFGEALIAVVEKLLSAGKHVVISGLAMTFDRQPFIPIPQLMALADKVTKLSAVCTLCGNDAVFHKRITKTKPVDPLETDPSLVGDGSSYQARCRRCYVREP